MIKLGKKTGSVQTKDGDGDGGSKDRRWQLTPESFPRAEILANPCFGQRLWPLLPTAKLAQSIQQHEYYRAVRSKSKIHPAGLKSISFASLLLAYSSPICFVCFGKSIRVRMKILRNIYNNDDSLQYTL